MLFIGGTVREYHGFMAGTCGQFSERLDLGGFGQLFSVTLTETDPLGRIAPEPFAERGARRQLFSPFICLCPFLANASRPDASYVSGTILCAGLAIDAFNTYQLGPPVESITLSTRLYVLRLL